MSSRIAAFLSLTFLFIATSPARADEPNRPGGPPSADSAFGRLDQNKDGVIDRDEFQAGFDARMAQRPGARRPGADGIAPRAGGKKGREGPEGADAPDRARAHRRDRIRQIVDEAVDHVTADLPAEQREQVRDLVHQVVMEVLRTLHDQRDLGRGGPGPDGQKAKGALQGPEGERGDGVGPGDRDRHRDRGEPDGRGGRLGGPRRGRGFDGPPPPRDDDQSMDRARPRTGRGARFSAV